VFVVHSSLLLSFFVVLCHSPQKIEVLQAAHKEEVAGLKNELLRRQSDVAKSIEERVQKDRQNAEMREEFHQLQSSLRVAESQVTRYEQDCVRLTSELQTARDQITQKDTDLRMSFQSAHEVQRQSSDEKNALRNEIRYDKYYTTVWQRVKSKLDIAELSSHKRSPHSCRKDL
jgi:DNA anti-recombination protein RmuC